MHSVFCVILFGKHNKFVIKNIFHLILGSMAVALLMVGQ